MQPVKQGVSEILPPRSISARIAHELDVKPARVEAAISLLDEGATVPFIARYRKERTGALDDTQLRALESRLHYLRELDERRASILKVIDEQGKLSDDLKKTIEAAETRTKLEDIYLPYKPKRRTKAQVAREAGLEPLAIALLDNPELEPIATAEKYIDADKGIADANVALEGARQILMENFTEQAELIGELREYLWKEGVLKSRIVKDKEEKGKKFADYFDYDEALHKIPSHRALALFRGRNEGILRLNLDVVVEDGATHPCEMRIAAFTGIRDQGRAADSWLLDTVRWAWKVRIHSRLDVDLKMRLRERAEEEAIRVFSHNLKDLLLAAPAGAKATLGLDPGLRTGVKVAVIDTTGKVLATKTIFPHVPRKEWDQSIAILEKLCREHKVGLVSIGNGTASRETDKLVADLIKRHPELTLQKLVVSEAGASVYSASELAAKEFPEMDVSLRGAVSIARRLQDPLAELVKIESKSIGVGQYQHDVNQVQLNRSLEGVVEDCVNAVGVDVNTASAPLLARIAGLNTGLAENIVQYRNDQGAFSNRQQLLKVKRLGAKTFEQAAGFLRIMKGENPLDASAVHPEAYTLVEKIAAHNDKAIDALIGDGTALKAIKPDTFVDEQFGLLTVRDILAELEKPGRDPRPEFKAAVFLEGVEKIADLQDGMVLEGVVTNVTNFGAFVDVGVHQDGLVHISQLSYSFVKDPREVVKAGDVVKVRVLEVDVERKRVGLSMRLEERKPATSNKTHKNRADKRNDKPKQNKRNKTKAAKSQPKKSQAQSNSAMADAFRKALR